MAGFYGADVEQLKLLGRELDQQAGQLEAITSRLTSRISSVAWHGPDAQRFQSEWRDRLVVSMRSTSNALRDASGRADANARQQEEASGGATSTPFDFFGLAPPRTPAVGDIIMMDDRFVWQTTRDAVNQKIPGTGWSYGDIGGLIPGADSVLTVRDIADSLRHGEVPIHEMVDVGAGALRSSGNPIAYGTGVAVGVWNTAIESFVEADIPNTWRMTFDYMSKDPWGAAQGALNGIVSGIPKIVKNFLWW